ncbi:hypothetical protein J1N35_023642 [Gossypium stocksii]|uniref:Uncharacterized protein n=1 Tax=Gossypium stocksii TaxID=47602 RepID=A0A9D3VJK7_9ROSI|nr:hypothetical protein J1N35_023642 [Gossypium stocksii]
MLNNVNPKGRTTKLDSVEDQFKGQDDLEDKVEKMQWTLNSIEKLMERNDDLEDMMMTLKEETKAMMTPLNTKIEKLKGELVVYEVAVEKGVLRSTPRRKMVVFKSKVFKGKMYMKGVNNFLWGMEQYFHAVDIEDDVTKQKLRKLRAKGFTKAMTEMESFVELDLRKDM